MFATEGSEGTEGELMAAGNPGMISLPWFGRQFYLHL